LKATTVTELRRYITPKQAASIYGFSAGDLANLRVKKKGPPFYIRGRKILYRVTDFEAWVTECPVKTTESVN
jgi:hypothetical protein